MEIESQKRGSGVSGEFQRQVTIESQGRVAKISK